jgi:hypothetical protein
MQLTVRSVNDSNKAIIGTMGMASSFEICLLNADQLLPAEELWSSPSYTPPCLAMVRHTMIDVDDSTDIVLASSFGSYDTGILYRHIPYEYWILSSRQVLRFEPFIVAAVRGTVRLVCVCMFRLCQLSPLSVLDRFSLGLFRTIKHLVLYSSKQTHVCRHLY